MNDRATVEVRVLDAIETVCPGRLAAAGVHDDLHLGEEDLGLDSIEIVEVLLACEEHYGIGVASLLEDDVLTFGRVVDHFVAR
jgi:acyl carrier protein